MLFFAYSRNDYDYYIYNFKSLILLEIFKMNIDFLGFSSKLFKKKKRIIIPLFNNFFFFLDIFSFFYFFIFSSFILSSYYYFFLSQIMFSKRQSFYFIFFYSLNFFQGVRPPEYFPLPLTLILWVNYKFLIDVFFFKYVLVRLGKKLAVRLLAVNQILTNFIAVQDFNAIFLTDLLQIFYPQFFYYITFQVIAFNFKNIRFFRWKKNLYKKIQHFFLKYALFSRFFFSFIYEFFLIFKKKIYYQISIHLEWNKNFFYLFFFTDWFSILKCFFFFSKFFSSFFLFHFVINQVKMFNWLKFNVINSFFLINFFQKNKEIALKWTKRPPKRDFTVYERLKKEDVRVFKFDLLVFKKLFYFIWFFKDKVFIYFNFFFNFFWVIINFDFVCHTLSIFMVFSNICVVLLLIIFIFIIF